MREVFHLKRTMVVCFVLSLACVAYGQEPINHAVIQPTVNQPNVSQPSVSQAGGGVLQVYQPFVYQPMANIPHQRTQPQVVETTARTCAQPAARVQLQPEIHQPKPCTSCGARPVE